MPPNSLSVSVLNRGKNGFLRPLNLFRFKLPLARHENFDGFKIYVCFIYKNGMRPTELL